MAKTRIQLTVEPEMGDLLKELAAETKSSLSGLIAELLMEMAPVLEKNLEIMRMARKVEKSGKDRITAHLKQTLKVLEEEIKQASEATNHPSQ